MKCPHCNRELEVSDTALINVDSYRNTVIVVTECCENPVTVSPIRDYRIERYWHQD